MWRDLETRCVGLGNRKNERFLEPLAEGWVGPTAKNPRCIEDLAPI
jgi:hypothetical protein